jgi:hypothetical protein
MHRARQQKRQLRNRLQKRVLQRKVHSVNQH